MKYYLILCFFLLASAAHSQQKLWTNPVMKNTSIRQLESGKIFVQDDYRLLAIDHLNGSTIWEKVFKSKVDAEFLEYLPIFFFEDKNYMVADAETGYVIDQSDAKTTILNIHYFWDDNRIIFELDQDNNFSILNIDLNNLTNSWKSLIGHISRKQDNAPILTLSGSLLFVDKKLVCIVDNKGKVIESLKFDKKLQYLNFNEQQQMLYVLENGKLVHFIDVESGIKTATFQFEKGNIQVDVIGDGSTVGVWQENELRILDARLGIPYGGKGFSWAIDNTYVEEETGRYFVLSKNRLCELNAASGKILADTTFDYSLSELYKLYDKVIIGGRSGASPINLSTLQMEYVKPSKIPTVHDYLELDEYVVYTHQSGTDFTISMVNDFGLVLWKETFYSAVTPSLDPVGDGILIISGRKARFLDKHTGHNIWNKAVEVDPSFAHAVDDSSFDLYMYSQKRLFRFDHSDGSLTRSKDKFKFDDFDYKNQRPLIIAHNDRVFLKGSNTIFILSKEGELIHEKSYDRISNGSTFWKIAGLVATVAAISSEGSQAFESVYVDLIDEGWYQAGRMDDLRRGKQNRSSVGYPFVHTKIDKKKKGLVFINPFTGAERFFILMDEDDPSYLIDEIDGVLFHLDKNALTAYDLR